ncbi:cardiolipin synthase [Leadbettera azotonutricia]|uniref:cardiolipin synthase n=1 Tax=Leadbettera azotonutricia TaxID=150829 RepID=UPI000302DBDB|nr:cardiolipin synthase [Leadbettera azotonutricia]
MEQKWVRVVFRQRVLIIALLLAQIVLLLFFAAGTSIAFRYVDFALNGFSIIVSLYILNKKEKAAFKITWIFMILLFPIFGGLVYAIFHTQTTPRKLRRATQASDKQYRPFFKLPGNSLSLLAGKYKECLPQANYLQEYAGFPIYTHTQSEFFNSGEAFFKKVLPELEKAEKYIFLEFFILGLGVMLNPIIAILEKKARAGLDIRIIYDDLGCFMSLPSNYKAHLEQKGIKCMVFNPFKPVLSSLQNNRDHRKIISIDGKVAFTGGINLADEYINARERFGHWKDAAVVIKGEAAWSLTLIFLQMWNIYHNQKDDPAAFYPWKDSPCTVKSNGFVQPYADSPIDEENVGEHVYIQIINNAKDYVYINTPYLVVDENLLSALTLAAKSGVDVRIITPHRWDKWMVAITSRSYYRQLIKAGVKVYEYTEGFNHSKTFVSDDKVATVGTTNLDFRSLYLHFECGVWMYKTRAVMAVKKTSSTPFPSATRSPKKTAPGMLSSA